jgi:hypothetical protein
MSIIELLRTRRQKRSGDATELARRVAAGEAIDPELILDATDAAGMTDEDFLALVELIARRTGLKATAATGPAAAAELQAVEAALTKHRQELDAAEQRYYRAVEPLEIQRSEAISRAATATAAAQALMREIPAELRQRIEETRQDVLSTSSALRQREATIEKNTRRVDDALAIFKRESVNVERMIAQYRDEEHRHQLSNRDTDLVRDVIRGRIAVEEATGQLPELTRAAAAAEAAHAAAQKAARDF